MPKQKQSTSIELEKPYSIRWGKMNLTPQTKATFIKAELESVAYDLDISLPQLLRNIAIGTVREHKK